MPRVKKDNKNKFRTAIFSFIVCAGITVSSITFVFSEKPIHVVEKTRLGSIITNRNLQEIESQDDSLVLEAVKLYNPSVSLTLSDISIFYSSQTSLTISANPNSETYTGSVICSYFIPTPIPTSITLAYPSSPYTFITSNDSTTGVPTLLDNLGQTVASVTYSISPVAPTGMTFDTATGEIYGEPSTSQEAGEYTITAEGHDEWDGLTTLQTISITTIDAPAVANALDGSNWTGRVSGTLTYTLNETFHTYSIAGSSGYQATNLQIPQVVSDGAEDYVVTGIEDSAFATNTNLAGTISFPSTLKQIGYRAFSQCTALTGALDLKNVESIGTAAFMQCTGFTGHLTLPTNVNFTTISESAFDHCSFTGTLFIPNNVANIGDGAFAYCSGFTGDLLLQNTVTAIGESAFDSCTGFSGALTLPTNSTYNEIKYRTFAECTFPTALVIPNTISTIGNSSFRDSEFTGDLLIPDSVTVIEESAFNGCLGFTGTLLLPNNPDFHYIGGGAFTSCKFSGALIIPGTVTHIGLAAFADCSDFTGDLYIPNSVEDIEAAAFINCTGITGQLTLPVNNNFNVIAENTFEHTRFSGELIIPNNVYEIQPLAFYESPNITSLVIPGSVTSIGSGAFESCTSISLISCTFTSSPDVGDSAFSGLPTYGTLENDGIPVLTIFNIFTQKGLPATWSHA